MLAKIKTFILDTLFPISCVSCRLPNVWLCRKCLEKIEILPSQVCPYCEKMATPAGLICPRCKTAYLAKNKTVPLDGLIVSAKYEGAVARLVHLFKYNFIEDLSVPLSEIIIRSFLKNNLPLPDLIVPVPLHPRRLRWRGFNQSELLAKRVSENLTPGFPLPVSSDLIARKKYTAPQMKIKNYRERQRNIAGSFAALYPPSPLGRGAGGEGKNVINSRTILLIDDICTTGSTLLECAKILKLNGARRVFGIVIARQEIRKR